MQILLVMLMMSGWFLVQVKLERKEVQSVWFHCVILTHGSACPQILHIIRVRITQWPSGRGGRGV